MGHGSTIKGAIMPNIKGIKVNARGDVTIQKNVGTDIWMKSDLEQLTLTDVGRTYKGNSDYDLYSDVNLDRIIVMICDKDYV